MVLLHSLFNVNETFADLTEKDFTVSITATGSGGTGNVGDVLSLTGNNHEGSAIFSLNGAKTTLTLDFGANYAAHDIKALVTLNKTVGTSKTKTLTTGSTLQFLHKQLLKVALWSCKSRY